MSAHLELERIADLRRRNFKIYQRMAAVTDAAAVGFKSRASRPDITLKLIERAAVDAPDKVGEMLIEIANNDEGIVAMTRLFAWRLRQERR